LEQAIKRFRSNHITFFTGIQIQKRTCSNPPPSNNGKPCVGSDQNTKKCNLGKCPEWQGWSDYSVCSKECGPGVQTRTRKCKVYQNDHDCVGKNEETRPCKGHNCPVGKFDVHYINFLICNS